MNFRGWVIIGCVVAFVILLFWWLDMEIAKEKAEFSAYLATEERNCLAAKETPYTCKAYITSLQSAHDAKEAKASAHAATAMSGVTMGMSAGRVR